MRKNKVLFWLIIIALLSCEMVLAWRVPGFSDAYVKYAFPLFRGSWGRLFGLVDFSVGEILIYLAVVYVCFTVILWLARFVKFCERKETLKAFSRSNTKFFIKLLIFVALLQVQNCFVLYHTTPLFVGTDYESYEPSREDLISLYEKLATTANALSGEFERNSKGEILMDEDLGSLAKIIMQGVGEDAKERVEAGTAGPIDDKLSLLSGYYSRPKPFFKSDFFSQQDIMGYYWPFTFEANYNDMMYVANLPSTMCHELSHTKGFIFEDEANFLSYVACANSDELFFVYSGTVAALQYVAKDVKKELALEPEIRNTLTPLREEVIFDSVFLTDEAWEEVEKDNWFDTKKVSEASNTFLDTNLVLNGVEDGVVSYSRVVNLLLKYYYGGEN